MMAKENHGSTCEKACGERKEVWRKSIGRRPSLTFSSPRNIRQLSLCACVCVLCYWSWERSGSIFILFSLCLRLFCECTIKGQRSIKDCSFCFPFFFLFRSITLWLPAIGQFHENRETNYTEMRESRAPFDWLDCVWFASRKQKEWTKRGGFSICLIFICTKVDESFVSMHNVAHPRYVHLNPNRIPILHTISINF